MTEKAVPVAVDEVRDRPTLVLLHDGTTLEIQMSIGVVERVEGVKTADGSPAYRVGTTLAIRAIPMTARMRKETETAK